LSCCLPKTNKLYPGFSETVELPEGGYLFIDDKAPKTARARVFDPLKHCFNVADNKNEDRRARRL